MSTSQLLAALAAGPFGLGTAPLGGLLAPVSAEDAEQALAAAWDGEVRYFDTAPHYGTGLAERRLGEFLAGKPRDEVLVSTKVGRLLVPGAGTPGEDGYYGDDTLVRVRDYSRDGVLASIESSLTRTGLDRLDIVLIHDPDEYWQQAVDGAYPALAQLRAEGVVGAIGAGMNQAEMLTRFVRETELDLVLTAGQYTLLNRHAAADLLPECARRGVAAVVAGVFNSGVLIDPRPGATYDYLPAPQRVLAAALELRELCARYGVPLAAAALQFPRRHPAVSAMLVGVRSAAEVRENLALLDVTVPDDLWAELDAATVLSGGTH